jgi:AraC-like DNA-binding protein
MSILEAGLRGGTVALLLLLALLTLRDAGRTPAGRNMALYALSAAAYVVSSAPDFPRRDVPLGIAVLALGLGTPAVFWMAAGALFDDELRPSWWRGLAWLGLVVLGLWEILFGVEGVAYYAFSLMFVALSAWHAVRGWKADLVEPRRRFRAAVVVAVALYIAAIVVADVLAPGSSISVPYSLANACGLAALTFIIAAALLARSGDEPSMLRPALAPAPAGSASRTEVGDPPALLPDAQETALLRTLRELMEKDRIYRQDDVSMAMVSAKLGIAEYRLRRLINRRLGHRNFSSFVNGYRLAEAMAALADPSQAEVPILTIALDAGFRSLAPFNRAFKANCGMTPSAFRRQRL